MRTTLTLEPDVAIELERRRRERGTSLKREVNELIRAGLVKEEELAKKPERRVRIRQLSVGAPLIENFDDIQGILDDLDGPFRL